MSRKQSMLDRARLIDGLRDEPNLSANAKLVGIVITSRCSRDGSAWPSWRRLQQDTSLSKNTLKRCVCELEAAGWMVVERRSNIDGQADAPNVYWPRQPTDTGSVADPSRGQGVTPPPGSMADHGKGHSRGHLAGSPADPRGSNAASSEGSTVDPKPSHLEPTQETNPVLNDSSSVDEENEDREREGDEENAEDLAKRHRRALAEAKAKLAAAGHVVSTRRRRSPRSRNGESLASAASPASARPDPHACGRSAESCVSSRADAALRAATAAPRQTSNGSATRPQPLFFSRFVLSATHVDRDHESEPTTHRALAPLTHDGDPDR